jgi:hypothetical protein
MRKFILFILLISIVLSKQLKNVAIIGSGISGLNLARILLKNTEFQIDMYESGSKIGGRIQSVPFNDTPLDVGSLSFHEGQQLINRLIKEYNLEKEPVGDKDMNPMGFINNTSIVFELSNSDLYNAAKLMWRYGMSVLMFQAQLEGFKSKLSDIYKVLEKKIAYKNLVEFNKLVSIDLPTNVTISQYIEEMNLSDLYVTEMVKATMRSYYNHDDMNVLAAFLTLAQVGQMEYKIKGGNKKLIKAMYEDCIKVNRFNLKINSAVKEITKNDSPGGFYTVTTSEGDKDYDLVIIATPLTVSGIKFKGLLEHLNKLTKLPKANPVRVTYIEGELNESEFGTNQFPRKLIPINPMTSANINAIFNLGKVLRLHSVSEVNQSELEGLNILKPGFKILNTYMWSYGSGKYDPINESDLPGYVLDSRLLYSNIHESVRSSMECSLICSTNLANLIEDMFLIKKKEDM